MQEAADAGAIAGAVELGLGGQDAVKRATDKARRMALANQKGQLQAAVAAVVVDKAAGTVAISLSMPAQKTLSALIIKQDATIAAAATAEIVDKTVACIFALNASASASLHGNGSAILEGTNCAIQVNSSASDAVSNSGLIKASHICIAGGYTGDGYMPPPQTGCAPVADPFVSTMIPAAGACSFTNFSATADAVLAPGTYCGGIKISGNANVFLGAGEYHIIDGPLKVSSGGSMEGQGVVFVLSGTASLDIAGSGRVATSPPTSGALAGFSVVQDRAAPLGAVSKITGEGQFDFPGIIYLPQSLLDVAGRSSGNVFTPSYAAIVADKIKISGQSELSAIADTGNFAKNATTTLTVVNTRLIR